MNRRKWIKYAFFTSTTGLLMGYKIPEPHFPKKTTTRTLMNQSHYQRVAFKSFSIEKATEQDFPQLTASVISKDGTPSIFKIPRIPQPFTPFPKLFLRLTVAGNHKDQKKIKVQLPQSGEIIGEMDLRYPVPLQVFELEIDPEKLDSIFAQGIELRQIEGEENLELYTGFNAEDYDWQAFCPHLLLSSEPEDKQATLLDALFSIRTLAPFGWEEGCSIDALEQLRQGPHNTIATTALRHRFRAIRALDHNWSGKKQMHSIESTLPFAALAKLDPNHPVLNNVIDFWDSRLRDHGVIADFSTTAEGAYTIAYPMAVFSDVLDRKDLATEALKQLRLRITGLTDNNDLYLRQRPDTLSRSYKNWARAYSWYMLGITRTINAIRHDLDTSDLRAEFKRISDIALQYQRADGLWPCYLDQPHILPDTAGSAGIAAAIAEGVRSKILPTEYGASLPKTWNTLLTYLTPDGLLTGVSQSNKGGDALQESNYRVMLSIGAGLMGQLYASLKGQQVIA